jgi:hypothetical protein
LAGASIKGTDTGGAVVEVGAAVVEVVLARVVVGAATFGFDPPERTAARTATTIITTAAVPPPMKKRCRRRFWNCCRRSCSMRCLLARCCMRLSDGTAPQRSRMEATSLFRLVGRPSGGTW